MDHMDLGVLTCPITVSSEVGGSLGIITDDLVAPKDFTGAEGRRSEDPKYEGVPPESSIVEKHTVSLFIFSKRSPQECKNCSSLGL